jgi:nucleoid DNA-binding protein
MAERKLKYHEIQRMGKWELADLVWEQSINISKQDARHFVNALFEHMKTTLLSGQEIRIDKFGTFNLHDKGEHWRYNAKAKRLVKYGRRSYVRFKPWPDMKMVHEQTEDV